MTRPKLRVGVIFGGRSGEHEVSLMSAASIVDALDADKYEVVPVCISKEGRWLLPGDAVRALSEGVERSGGRPVAVLSDPGVQGLVPVTESNRVAPRLAEQIDVMFPVLHGTYGEDGTIQGLFELADVPYVGAGVTASAVGMDKALMKDLFVRHGLPVARYRVYRSARWRREPEQVVAEVEEALGYPCFVKPTNLGSSVGVHKCRDRAALRAGLDDAARYDRKLLVEEAVPGAREIEVSVLGGEESEASVPGEVVPSREFYDYRAKYLDDASELRIPAPVTEEQAGELRRLAVGAFRALDCEGMARVDFFLRPDAARIYVNELNTIPGFTRISMYPKLWEASGLPYPRLLDRLIELALERHREKRTLTTDYEPPPDTAAGREAGRE